MKMKKIISLLSVLAIAGTQIFSAMPAFAAQTTFANDLSASCGYVAGDIADTQVTNFLAVAQQYYPSGTILSWNNPDDADAESIKLFKNGVQIEADAEWNMAAGAFNKIGVDAFANSDVFTLKLKKDGVEKTYTAPKVPVSATSGDWTFGIRDDWYSASEPTNYYTNGGAYLDTTVGYESTTSIKMVSNKFQPTQSGNDANHSQNVSNDADVTATWSIPVDQGTLENGKTYELRYKVKTVNAGRLYVMCNDNNRWNSQNCNQHISRNSDWVTKTKTFTKTDNITSFTFTIPVKTDAVWIDDVTIGYVDPDTDEYVVLIEETFEVDPTDYEPVNFFMAPGAGVKSVSWVNPNVQDITKIELWQVEEAGDTLISDDFNLSGGARQDIEIASTVRLVKGIFYFDVGRVIEIFATVDNTTLWGDSIPGWIFGLNQQNAEVYKYNPAVFRVDETNSASDDGTASAKYITNHPSVRDKTFVSTNNDGITVEEGKKYEVSMMIKADGNVAGIKANIGGAGLFDGYANSSVEGTNGNYDWKQVTFTYTAPSSGEKVISFEIPYGTKGFWIDDLEAYELNEAGERVGDNLITNGDISDYDVPTGMFEDLDAVGGDRKITLSWTNGEGYQSIWVYQKIGGEWYYRGSVPNSRSSITFTNLEREEEYTYKLVPVTKFGVGRDAEIISATTQMLDYEITEPELVGAENLMVGENTIRMTAKNNKLAEDLSVEMLVGIYKDGVLQEVKSANETLAISDAAEAPTPIEVDFEIGDDGEYEVRVMVIDSRSTLNSYFDMYTFEVPEIVE